MANKTKVSWPQNTKLYVTLKRVQASMPKPHTGKMCISKPINPNGKHSKKKVR